jgi:predicted nucleic acid-binding protein
MSSLLRDAPSLRRHQNGRSTQQGYRVRSEARSRIPSSNCRGTRTLVAADSSAIVKLVLSEAGSELARLVWAEADAVQATRLARVEAAAALAAARRARRIRRAGEQRAHGELELVWRAVVPVELDEPLETRATALARTHGISGGDAVHLAAALETGAALMTWDRRLTAAAVTEGLAVIPQG